MMNRLSALPKHIPVVVVPLITKQNYDLIFIRISIMDGESLPQVRMVDNILFQFAQGFRVYTHLILNVFINFVQWEHT